MSITDFSRAVVLAAFLMYPPLREWVLDFKNSFFLRLFSYHLSEHHPLVIFLENHGFRRAQFASKLNYVRIDDNRRLVAVFDFHVPNSQTNLRGRLRVYRSKLFNKSKREVFHFCWSYGSKGRQIDGLFDTMRRSQAYTMADLAQFMTVFAGSTEAVDFVHRIYVSSAWTTITSKDEVVDQNPQDESQLS